MDSLRELIIKASGGYGARPDGSAKGAGWLGEIRDKNGDVMTELTAEADYDGKRIMYPLITPNQGFRNLSELVMGITPSEDTHRLAFDHAMDMIRSGRSQYKHDPYLK